MISLTKDQIDAARKATPSEYIEFNVRFMCDGINFKWYWRHDGDLKKYSIAISKTELLNSLEPQNFIDHTIASASRIMKNI